MHTMPWCHAHGLMLTQYASGGPLAATPQRERGECHPPQKHLIPALAVTDGRKQSDIKSRRLAN